MANQNIHTGFWIDHSKGSVLGATITLDAIWGSQLVSAAAIVVQIIGASFWTILAFGVHQYRASPNLKEPDRQLQVLLRNSAGPDWAAWNIASIVKQRWRKENPEGFNREAGLLGVTSAVIYVGFLVAGIFVGFITLNQFSSTDVLLKPGSCGFIEARNTDASANGFNHVNINVSSAALQYARSCYNGAGAESAISCGVFPVPSLNYTVQTGTQCPVPGGEACFTGEDSDPVTVTSKVLDSHYDMGINAPAEDRMTLQYRATCAPMSYDFVDSLTKVVNESDGAIGRVAVQQFHTGSFVQSTFSQNYTFSYAPFIRFWSLNVVGYAVNAYRSYFPHSTGYPEGWHPSAPFNESKTDLSLFFLTPNGITFAEPVQDPMFRTFDKPTQGILGPDRYLPERSVYLLACGEEWQVCNPKNDKCTGWSGTVKLATRLDQWKEQLSMNDQQNATFNRLAGIGVQSSLWSAVNGVEGALLASGFLNTPTGSLPLPNGHWRTEVEGWFQAALAKMQFYQNLYVAIPQDALVANHIAYVPPQTAAERSQCSQQRVVSPSGYQSYSFFGIILIAFFGLLIPFIAFALKRWHHVFKNWGRDSYRRRTYEEEDIWAIYKKASKHGHGSVDNYDDDDDDENDGSAREGESVRLQDDIGGVSKVVSDEGGSKAMQ